jgi:hypothetical protein
MFSASLGQFDAPWHQLQSNECLSLVGAKETYCG